MHTFATEYRSFYCAILRKPYGKPVTIEVSWSAGDFEFDFNDEI